jgi:hypothetical protein
VSEKQAADKKYFISCVSINSNAEETNMEYSKRLIEAVSNTLTSYSRTEFRVVLVRDNEKNLKS